MVVSLSDPERGERDAGTYHQVAGTHCDCGQLFPLKTRSESSCRARSGIGPARAPARPGEVMIGHANTSALLAHYLSPGIGVLFRFDG